MSTDQQQPVFHPPGVIRLITPAEYAARAPQRPRPARIRHPVAAAPFAAVRRRARALLVAGLGVLLSGCAAAQPAATRLTPHADGGRTGPARVRPQEPGRYSRVEEMLAGRVPGLDVLRTADGRYTLRVRSGLAMQRGRREPLLVVDGLPIGFGADASGEGAVADFLTTLAPADVHRIALLTDVASTAVYGSRGANGVLLITTRTRAPRHTIEPADSGESQPPRPDLPESPRR